MRPLFETRLKRFLIHLYNAGYLQGHHDTVERQFVAIKNCDIDSYQEDIIMKLVNEIAKSKLEEK